MPDGLPRTGLIATYNKGPHLKFKVNVTVNSLSITICARSILLTCIILSLGLIVRVIVLPLVEYPQFHLIKKQSRLSLVRAEVRTPYLLYIRREAQTVK
jgi:hypothetical protein